MIVTFDELVERSLELTDGYLQALKKAGDREADQKHIALCEYFNSYLFLVKATTKVEMFQVTFDVLRWFRDQLLTGRFDVYVLRDKVRATVPA